METLEPVALALAGAGYAWSWVAGLRKRGGPGPLWAAVAMHWAVLAIRGVHAGQLPIYSGFEFVLCVSAGIGTVGAAFQRVPAGRGVNAFLLPVVLGLLAYAGTLPSSIQPVALVLRGLVLKMHVVTAVVAYSAWTGTFAASVLLLWGKPAQPDSVDGLAYVSSLVATGFMTVCILSGALWADQVWGRLWSWDPKETWSLITWLVFVAYGHARFHRGWRGSQAAWLAVAGFALVGLTYLGVDLLARPQHAFGS